MRIYVKEGEEVLQKFPSVYLKNDITVTVIFPQGYTQESGGYASVYVIGHQKVNKEQIKKSFHGQNGAQNALIAAVALSGYEETAALANFITKELLPYFEMNYGADPNPQKRVIAASGGEAAQVLEMLESHGGYFKTAALLMQDNMAMPHVKNLSAGVRIWAAGRAGNMARLQFVLEDAGLKYPDDFAFKIFSTVKDELLWGELNFSYLFNKESVTPLKSTVFYKGAGRASLADLTPLSVWLDIKTKAGYKINYVPRELRIAPPFFVWDAAAAELTPLYGAEQGNIKISASVPFGKDIATTAKITK